VSVVVFGDPGPEAAIGLTRAESEPLPVSVPLSAPAFSTCLEQIALKRSGLSIYDAIKRMSDLDIGAFIVTLLAHRAQDER
jgi:hypothetical protein